MAAQHIALSADELAQALENCAKEPIHLIGAIQPHGVLLVLAEPEMEIVQVSKNTEDFFGTDAASLLHKPLDVLLGEHQTTALKKITTSGELQPLKSMLLDIEHRRFDAVMHRSGKQLILELEPAPMDGIGNDLQDFYDHLRQFSIKLRESDRLDSLFQTIVDEVRTLTGFDRVKLYKFDTDWNGTVIAESRVDIMPSYLGLRFPASDIPEQARKLYSKNYLRMIADVHYQPVPIISDQDSGEMIDLSLSVLRSVSPVHIQYLDNMNVHASMSISVIQNRKLWGLIACHHNTPRYVPYKVRMAAELIGHMFSCQLSSLEESERSEQEHQQKLLLADIAVKFTSEKSLTEAVEQNIRALQDILLADGVVIVLDKQHYIAGEIPDKTALSTLLDWLDAKHQDTTFATHKLSEHLQLPEQAASAAAGVFAVPLGRVGRILWLRRETVQHVNWAGKPEKTITTDSVGFRLTPRGSFALWQETLQGLAPVWTEENRHTAAKIVELLNKKIQQEDLRQREAALTAIVEQNAAHREAIFNAVKEGILTFDINGIIQSINPAISGMLGYKEQEILNKNIKVLVPNSNIKYPVDKKHKPIAGSMHEVIARHKNGHNVPVELAVEEMQFGDQLMLVATLRDLSERKALQESQYLREEFVNASYDGYWDWHIQDDYEYMSPRFWEIFGFKPEEKKHHPSEWQALIFDEDLKPTLESFNKHIETKGKHPFYQEVRYRHKNGSTVTVICRGQVVDWDADGKPLRMIGVHTDVTALKKAEADLRESEQRFALVVDGARDGVWDWRNTGNPDEQQYWSPQLFHLLGFEDGEINTTYHDFSSRLHPDDIERINTAVEAHIKNDEVYDVEFRLQQKNGDYKWFQARGTKSLNDDGTQRFTGSLTDIAERKAVEQQLKRSNEELDEFAYIASHDLKEPLRGIHNHAHFLHRDSIATLSEDAKRRLNRVIELTQHMETLISDLLYFSRIGRAEIAMQKTDLNIVAKDIIKSIPMLEEQHVQVNIVTTLPSIVCDKVRVGEVFRNLITNAVKYNDKQNKKIEIGNKQQTVDSQSQQVLFVKDNGIGIDEEFYQDVFRIFKRLHKKSAYGGGTGAGLTFVKKIIERHGGDIWLESETGKGSTFFFTLSGKQPRSKT